MILITVFDPQTRKVLSHKSVSHADMVLVSLHEGTNAVVGRWIPYDELVPERVDFFLTGNEPAPRLPDLQL